MDGNGLIEIVRSEVVGDRGSSRARLGAWPCPIRAVFVVQPFFDGIPAHGDAFKRRLRILPHQWALQGDTEAVFRLPQRCECCRQVARASANDQPLRELPPHNDVAGNAVHRPHPGDWSVRQLSQRHDRPWQIGQPPGHGCALRKLPPEHGELWRGYRHESCRNNGGVRQLPQRHFRIGQICEPRPHHRAMRGLPQEHDHVARRNIHPRGRRHQLLELPQRHHRDRHDDAAAHSGGRSSVQQLPYQYGGEFCDLHDGRAGSYGRQHQPVRLLSQRLVHG